MKGSEWLKSLPSVACEDREQAIISAVREGLALDTELVELITTHEGHTGRVRVGTDVLRIGEPDDFVRVNVCARTAQVICDLCGWILPTPKIVDLLWKQGRQVEPALQPASGSKRLTRGYSADMSDTEAMERHSADVTELAGSAPGLFENAGKHWVLCNSLLKRAGKAANYGYFSRRAPYLPSGPGGLTLWQSLGLAHNLSHVDYSQTLRPVAEYMAVDGTLMRVAEVAADPDLWPLVSYEGPLRLSRLPGVASELRQALSAPQTTRARLSFGRLLRRHCDGEDVRQWQSFIGVGVDGDFGPITERATRAWQKAHDLKPDGIVGPITVAKANETMRIVEVSEQEGSIIDDFIPTKNFSRGEGRELKWIIIHSAEIVEKPTSAEALASWLSGPHAPRASWHFAVDNDSIVQSVREADIAWHAPGANRYSIGIEHAGYARQSTVQWLDEFSREMLLRSARLVAYLCKKYDIPVRFVDRKGLKAGVRGISTHNEVSFAWRKTTHTDPGPHFPMDWYLAEVSRSIS